MNRQLIIQAELIYKQDKKMAERLQTYLRTPWNPLQCSLKSNSEDFRIQLIHINKFVGEHPNGSKGFSKTVGTEAIKNSLMNCKREDTNQFNSKLILLKGVLPMWNRKQLNRSNPRAVNKSSKKNNRSLCIEKDNSNFFKFEAQPKEKRSCTQQDNLTDRFFKMPTSSVYKIFRRQNKLQNQRIRTEPNEIASSIKIDQYFDERKTVKSVLNYRKQASERRQKKALKRLKGTIEKAKISNNFVSTF